MFADAEQSVVDPRRAARVPDPDDDRRAALGDRHRGHGPAGAPQRAGHERPGRRGGGRLRDAAARQDGHDHVRQPPGRRSSCPVSGVDRAASSPMPRSSRASPTRRPKAARSWCWPRSATACASASCIGADAGALHRADPHERRRLRRTARCARARPSRCGAGSRSRAASVPPSSATRSTRSPPRAARRSSWPRPAAPTAPPPRTAALGVIHLKDIVKPGIARALRRPAARWASAR